METKSQQNSGRALPVLVLIILIANLIIILPGYILWTDYSGRIAKAEQSMRFVTNLVAVQIKANMEEQKKMLLGIERELQHSHMNTETPLNKRGNNYLLGIMSTYKSLMDILILDATGSIIQWTGNGLPPTVTDRLYTSVHTENPDSGLFVGEPLLSRVHKDQWFFAVSLPVRASDGRLLNIIVAIIDIEQFQSQFQGIDLPSETVLGVINKSGKVIARIPDHDRVVGMQVDQAAAIWKKGSVKGIIDINSPFDQVDRIVGYQLIEKYGFGTYSGISKKAVLERFYFYLILTACVVLTIVFVLVILSRRIFNDQQLMTSQQEQLFILAHTDELTGLCNRRHFMALSEAEQKRSRRYQHPLSYMMLDIDHFKAINDTYGHDSGDIALVSFAETLRSTCRNQDILSRYGGEEFLIMLPETSREKAMSLAERLRKAVEDSTITAGSDSIKFTVSIGVATIDLTVKELSPYAAIKQADEALYQAKRSGRNQVC